MGKLIFDEMEDKITQEELDNDQAYWCNQLIPKEWLTEKNNPPVVESYKFVIFDISDIEPVKIKK